MPTPRTPRFAPSCNPICAGAGHTCEFCVPFAGRPDSCRGRVGERGEPVTAASKRLAARKDDVNVSRRALLRGTGALIISFALPPLASARQAGGLEPVGAAARLPGSLGRAPFLDAWIRIDADGTVTAFTGKAELGQGVKTALAQVVSEELEVPLDRLKPVTAGDAPEGSCPLHGDGSSDPADRYSCQGNGRSRVCAGHATAGHVACACRAPTKLSSAAHDRGHDIRRTHAGHRHDRPRWEFSGGRGRAGVPGDPGDALAGCCGALAGETDAAEAVGALRRAPEASC